MQGILMKSDMLQATVERRKAQTRRLIKPQPVFEIWSAPCGVWRYKGKAYDNMYDIPSRYHVGETCYIKEAWNANILRGTYRIEYKLDNAIKPLYVTEKHDCWLYPPTVNYRTPRFMPAWAARHFIFIEAVSGERLQEITEQDVLAEGIMVRSEGFPICALRVWYQVLWDSINSAYPWESNPFCWAYQFRLES